MKPLLRKGRAYTNSLRFRLIIYSVLVELLMLGLMIGNNLRESSVHLTSLAQNRVDEMAETFSISLAPSLAARDFASLRSLVDRLVNLPDITYLAVLAPDGRILSASGLLPDPWPAPMHGIPKAHDVFHAQVPVVLYGQTYGTMRYGLSLSALRQAEHSLLFQGLVIGGMEITMTILALSSIAFFLTSKLENLTRASARMAAGDYETLVGVKGNDEVAVLSAAFNSMADAVRQQIRQLQSNEANLRRSNQELAKLADVTAHHLQEPLRRVTSYSQLLALRLSDQLDPDAKDFINYVVGGAGEMKRLLVDLQSYIAIDVSPLAPDRQIDLGKCALAAKRDLSLLLQENDADVTIDPLPTVVGDAQQMQLLFTHLIRNAVVHRSPDRTPQIRIHAENQDSCLEISVCDNGPGINPEYGVRVFDLFQKLSRDSKGTGVGLAVVRKVAERHNGRTWITSQPDKGLCVHFTVHDGREV